MATAPMADMIDGTPASSARGGPRRSRRVLAAVAVAAIAATGSIAAGFATVSGAAPTVSGAAPIPANTTPFARGSGSGTRGSGSGTRGAVSGTRGADAHGARAVKAPAARGHSAAASSPAGGPLVPTVTVTVPTTNQPASTCTCLRGSITLSATATPATGESIDHVDFQVSPSGANTWTTIDTVTTAPYFAFIDLTNPVAPSGANLLPGDYDVRAVATDSAGDVGTSPAAQDIVFADQGATFIALTDPGAAVHGTVTLRAAAEPQPQNLPTQALFQSSPAGTEQWTTFATVNVPVDQFGVPIASAYSATLDTTTLPDGPLDLRIEASDPNGDVFVSRPVRASLVDNTPPTSSVSVPSGPLSGVITLSATAQDSGSGVASVAFQDAPAGSGDWSTIGAVTTPPYSLSFDTRALSDGRYDFRVLATDVVGNQAPSAAVQGVAISNPSSATVGDFAITNYVVPATRVSLLGEIAGSPQHETWAYGFTTAPPATVNGEPLPYTAGVGNPQLVLLRYTDATSWQIVDVLRNVDDSAYQLASNLSVSGQMDPSGEGWIVVRQTPPGQVVGQVALFHKLAGSTTFVLDPAASGAVGSLLAPQFGSSGPPQLSVGEGPDGVAYGLLLYPEQAPQAVQVASGGQQISVNEALTYAALVDGAWTLHAAPLPAGWATVAGESDTLAAADLTGPGTGWGAIESDHSHPLLLAQFDTTGWHFVTTGLDALDLSGRIAAVNPVFGAVTIHADTAGAWLGTYYNKVLAGGDSHFVARYDDAAQRVVSAWCAPGTAALSTGCTLPLDANHPAAVPTAVFNTPGGQVAEAVGAGFVGLYQYGRWIAVPAPGFFAGPGRSLFTDPTDGWLVGPDSVAQITPKTTPSPLALWTEANQSPLVSIALPPAGAWIGTSGPLAVGLDGAALHYDASAGWLVDPTPTRAQHVALRSVAFDGPKKAVAVGDFGTILDWNGTTWTNDPQSTTLTINRLNAVAFRSDGQGWAVGSFGTILHWDGSTWTPEQVDATDQGVLITSVAVAGQDVFAVAGGNLIERTTSGQWQRVDPSELPSPAPAAGSLRLVSGLPDGGLVAAGQSVVIVRQNSSSPFTYSTQPINGNAVALSAFRDPVSGQVRAFVSVSPPVAGVNPDVNGFPSGDGELLVQGTAGFVDLSRAQPAGGVGADGAVVPDPVLAVAAGPDGSAAWAVGGYAGTETADGLGTSEPLQARPSDWQSSSIWRYDAGGSQTSPALTSAAVNLAATPGTVSFAFFSSPACRIECATSRDAQPDVNLSAAATQIASFAQQPGGPAFAVLGGDAVGPVDQTAWNAGNGAVDLADLSSYLAPLGNLPLFAAYGPRDAVPTTANSAQAWAAAFAQAPAPFGEGPVPPAITPAGAGEPTGSVNRYYAFDAEQHGGGVRVIVLDNSKGSLELSSPGQTAWLDGQLASAHATDQPVVVITALPLNGADQGAAADGLAIAAKLAAAGVLGVFTTGGSDLTSQADRIVMIGPSGGPQIPEYESATLGYQEDQNNGVLWYFVSIDTVARKLTVQAIPVVQLLALEPLSGLTVLRSSTLDFKAIGRRPPGTIATLAGDTSLFPGVASYVSIPSGNCVSSGCMSPSYSFTSADPTIGDFVTPSAPGSVLPKLDPSGTPIPSSQSGLFCAYNAGTTTVSVTSGLLNASLPVTVQAGDIGRPCGTVSSSIGRTVVTVPTQRLVTTSRSPSPLNVTVNLPPTVVTIKPTLPQIALPHPPPAVVPLAVAPPNPVAPRPVPPPKPARPLPQPTVVVPQAGFVPATPSSAQTQPVIVPPIAPGVTPVPPGGATVSAQAAARREEKARKHARQSAFTTRPAGVSAVDWFYAAVGVTAVLGVLLAAEGLSGPSRRLALVELWQPNDPRRRRTRRYR